ncbi:MAG: hypothetical protein ACI91Z_001293, partial [Yoonia sp.]
MKLLNHPMSQEQKRLRLRDVMKLLMEGEDFDYIRMKIRETFPANLNQRELKDIALKIAMLPVSDREALIRDITPDRFDDRHFQAAISEKKQRAGLLAEQAQNQKAKRDQRAEKIERAGAASQKARLKWNR